MRNDMGYVPASEVHANLGMYLPLQYMPPPRVYTIPIAALFRRVAIGNFNSVWLFYQCLLFFTYKLLKIKITMVNLYWIY